MRNVHLLVVAWALMATAPPLLAQQPRPQRNDAASKDAIRPMARVSPDMTTHCSTITRLQNSALEAATRAEQLSHAQHLNRPVIQAQALTSRNDLQALLKELDATESSANELQKAVIASLLIHDRQAEQHADELVGTAQKQDAQGSDIATRASAVIQHVQAAQVAMRTDPNTGLPTGQRRSLLCSAPATVGRKLKPVTGQLSGKQPPVPSTGQASGKRQY